MVKLSINELTDYNSQPGPWKFANMGKSKNGKEKMDYKTVIWMVSRNSFL